MNQTNIDQDFMDYIEEHQGITTTAIVDRFNRPTSTIRNYKRKTLLILNRIQQQPDKKAFLEGFFMLKPVKDYMMIMDLTPESFTAYIETVVPLDEPKQPLTRDELLNMGIEVLHLSSDTHERLLKQNIQTVGDILHMTYDELRQTWMLGRRRPAIIVARVEQWCKTHHIPLSDYPMGLNFQESDPKLNETYKRGTDESIDVLDITPSLKEKLKNQDIYTINELLNKRESELKRIPLIGDRSITHIMTAIETYMHDKWEFNPRDLNNKLKTMGLSVRATNALARTKIRTINDLLNTTPKRLNHISDVGIQTFEHILTVSEQWVNSNGYDKNDYPLFDTEKELDSTIDEE